MYNKRQRIAKTWENKQKYRSKRGTSPPVQNAAHFAKNDKAHEMRKCEVALNHYLNGHTILTECVRKSDGRIVDVYCATEDIEIEVVNKNRNKKTLERYEKEGIEVVYV